MKDTGERLIAKGNMQTLTYGEHISRYLAVLDLVKGKEVLDVASGSGYGTQLIAQHAKTVVGLDNNSEAVEYAQKNYPAKNVTYVQGDAHKMPFKDKSFDVIVSLETIEHLPRPEEFIAEVKRLLKKGGQFIVSTPNDDEFMEGNVFHVHEFHLPELKALIKKNFKNSELYYQGTWLAAGLLSKDGFSHSLEPQKLQVTKTFAQAAEKAIFFIAIASDGSLSKLEQNIAIADRWSSKEDMEREIVRTNARNELEAEIDLVKSELTMMKTRLELIELSRWWALRNKLIAVGNKIGLRR